MDFAEIRASLTRRVGPLPVWVWALLTAILVYIFWRYHRSKAGSATSPQIGYPIAGANYSPYAGQDGGGGSITFPDLPSLASLPNTQPQESSVTYYSSAQSSPQPASEPVVSSQIASQPIAQQEQSGGLFQIAPQNAPATGSGSKVVGVAKTANGVNIPTLAQPGTNAGNIASVKAPSRGSLSTIVSSKTQKAGAGQVIAM